MLTGEEIARYDRQLILPGWGTGGQEILKKSVVFVAGAGGLGSSALTYLAAAGAGTLRVCDCDAVEASNLNRQTLHDHSRIGVNKAASAALTIAKMNPLTAVEVLTEKINSESIGRLAGRADILLDCLDNYETRRVLNDFSVRRHIPLVFGGVRGMEGQLSFFWPPRTPCFCCLYPEGPVPEKFPVVGAIPGVIGTLQALEAVKFLLGLGTNLAGRLLVWDGASAQFRILAVPKDPGCAVCGAGKPVFPRGRRA